MARYPPFEDFYSYFFLVLLSSVIYFFFSFSFSFQLVPVCVCVCVCVTCSWASLVAMLMISTNESDERNACSKCVLVLFFVLSCPWRAYYLVICSNYWKTCHVSNLYLLYHTLLLAIATTNSPQPQATTTICHNSWLVSRAGQVTQISNDSKKGQN